MPAFAEGGISDYALPGEPISAVDHKMCRQCMPSHVYCLTFRGMGFYIVEYWPLCRVIDIKQ
ncbi:hypothetical protein ACW6AV_001626 [Edwardsiella piscicida]|uniref:Uncharacterized protein n=2 Tax=Edwardsiella TaxID=635 RepID=A0A0H3DR09_EDWTF|nr:hypothetical protein [Edwardsiella piscicida]ACY84731.1 hypothetical protein ETAE_1894 [Edwardsiella tarda EIB202]ADM41815.1 hypothetical protein ETAF_1707 [Edwardsiella tarda FL6-60]ARD19796.1 hypothetical protein BXA22_16255 [Edwardsiella piscicida]ELM3738076.1 hypothetical protein [Edwardsiella piscicida]MDM3863488.1 hypothetical protein [Edwardsiella piscicida]